MTLEKLVPEKVLVSWKNDRKNWSYENSLANFNKTKKLLKKIPTLEEFLEKILEILELNDNQREKIENILNSKSEAGWSPDNKEKSGPKRTEEGIDEYIKNIEDGLDESLASEKKESMRRFLKEISDNLLDLFKIPYSSQMGTHYYIINGNNYIKVLKFLDNIRAYNKEELKKYEPLTEEYQAPEEDHQDKYKIWPTKNKVHVALLELLGWANLEKEDAYLYNGKVDRIKHFLGDSIEINDFNDLFDFITKYNEFVEESYLSSFYLSGDEDYLNEFELDIGLEEKKKVLKHIEVDQLFQYWHENLDRNFWSIYPGPENVRDRNWNSMRSNQVIGLGFLSDVNFNQLAGEEDIKEKLKEELPDKSPQQRGQYKRSIKNFKKIEKNDIILVANSQSSILAVGEVADDYRYDKEALPEVGYPHVYPVKWLSLEEIDLDDKHEDWTISTRPVKEEDALNILSGVPEISYFIFGQIYDSSYEELKNGTYHFKKRIPLHDRVTAGSKFVYYHPGERRFLGTGKVNQVNKENEDYYARIEDYSEFEEGLSKDEVEEDLSSDFRVPQEGITETSRVDFEKIIEVAEDEGLITTEEIREPGIIGPELEKLSEEEEAFIKDNIEVIAHILAGENIIFYGPPGTGKTRESLDVVKHFCGEENYELVTAHGEWTSYDVVGGPKLPSEADPTDDFKPGFLTKAADANTEPYWLIIDEINRANLDQAFGQAFTLLDVDMRDDALIKKSEYKKRDHDVILPKHFRILATMNSYDKALLFKLGYAFRRRFAFCEVPSPFLSQTKKKHKPLEAPNEKWKKYVAECEKSSYYKNFNLELIDEWINSLKKSQSVILSRLPPSFIDILKETWENFKSGDFSPVNPVLVLLELAKEITEEDKVELGWGQVTASSKFILSYIALKNPGDGEMYRDIGEALDRAVNAYYVPHFEFILPKLRKESYIGKEENPISIWLDKIIEEFESLGMYQSKAKILRLKNQKEPPI